MNKTKLLLSIIFGLTCIFTSSFAATPPKTCPAPAEIIKNGLIHAERDDEEGAYEVGQISAYNTQHTWGFVVMVPFYLATNEAEAIQLAKQALPNLQANFNTPIYSEGMYICLYTAGQFQAGAVTPLPLNDVAKRMQFRK